MGWLCSESFGIPLLNGAKKPQLLDWEKLQKAIHPISKKHIGLFCFSLVLSGHLIICMGSFMSIYNIELIRVMIWLSKLRFHFLLWASVIKTGLIFYNIIFLQRNYYYFLCYLNILFSLRSIWIVKALIFIIFFRLHCVNLLEEQQRVFARVENLTIESPNSTELNGQNTTLDFLNKLLDKSGCFDQICTQLEEIVTSAINKWQYEMQDFTNATYEAIMTRSKLR